MSDPIVPYKNNPSVVLPMKLDDPPDPTIKVHASNSSSNPRGVAVVLKPNEDRDPLLRADTILDHTEDDLVRLLAEKVKNRMTAQARRPLGWKDSSSTNELGIQFFGSQEDKAKFKSQDKTQRSLMSYFSRVLEGSSLARDTGRLARLAQEALDDREGPDVFEDQDDPPPGGGGGDQPPPPDGGESAPAPSHAEAQDGDDSRILSEEAAREEARIARDLARQEDAARSAEQSIADEMAREEAAADERLRADIMNEVKRDEVRRQIEQRLASQRAAAAAAAVIEDEKARRAANVPLPDDDIEEARLAAELAKVREQVLADRAAARSAVSTPLPHDDIEEARLAAQLANVRAILAQRAEAEAAAARARPSDEEDKPERKYPDPHASSSSSSKPNRDSGLRAEVKKMSLMEEAKDGGYTETELRTKNMTELRLYARDLVKTGQIEAPIAVYDQKKAPLINLLVRYQNEINASREGEGLVKRGKGFAEDVSISYTYDVEKLKSGVLSISQIRKNGRKVKIAGFRNTAVSPAFIEAFQETLTNGRIADLSDLKAGEKDYLLRVLALTKPSLVEVKNSHREALDKHTTDMNTDRNSSVTKSRMRKLRERLLLLAAEVKAGNTENPKINSEIKSILTTMVKKGMVNREEASQFIMQFVK